VSRLEGKVALITGAGAGLGRGVARRFVREGAAVVVAEVNKANGEETVEGLKALGGKALFVETDVSQKEQMVGAVERTVSEFGGRLDILVNNASALSPNILLEQKTDEMLDTVLRTTLWHTWWSMQAAFPVMRDQGGGRIVNFFSIDAEVGAWLHVDYNMGKSAILGLTRTAAMEWARHGILVNAVAPTGRGTVFEELAAGIPGFEEMAAGMCPLGRVGDPEEDVAPAVLFLCSDDARYITGELLHVDGGQHLPRYNSKPEDFSMFEQ
jgi:NAD(P)-dependent dehydrogenase (short-subunit alcohol dehydrogenase family)